MAKRGRKPRLLLDKKELAVKSAVKKELSKKFLDSMRGQYIVSQALYIAAREMKKVPVPYREVSNILDMEFLNENLFPLYPQIQAAISTK